MGERLWVVEEEMDGWFEAKAFDGRYTAFFVSRAYVCVHVRVRHSAGIHLPITSKHSHLTLLTGDRIGFVPSTYVRKV